MLGDWAMKRLLTAAALVLVVSTQSRADPYTYTLSQWERLDTSHRAWYIAGFIDSYLTFSAGHESRASFFSTCLAGQKVTYEQMAAGVKAMAALDPPDAKMPVELVGYLFQLCGPLPTTN